MIESFCSGFVYMPLLLRKILAWPRFAIHCGLGGTLGKEIILFVSPINVRANISCLWRRGKKEEKKREKRGKEREKREISKNFSGLAPLHAIPHLENIEHKCCHCYQAIILVSGDETVCSPLVVAQFCVWEVVLL